MSTEPTVKFPSVPSGYYTPQRDQYVTDKDRWQHPTEGGPLTAPVDAVGMTVAAAETKWDWARIVRPMNRFCEAPAASIREHTLRPMKFDAADKGPARPRTAPYVPKVPIHPTILAALDAPESAVDEARRLVLGPRNADYGNPKDDYTRTAKIWSGMLADILKQDITPEQAMLMMVGLKLSREMHKPKRDNLVDAHGYLLCYEWASTGQKPTTK